MVRKVDSFAVVRPLLVRNCVPGEQVVNTDAPTPRRAPVVYEILAYLADHPKAQDTVEGIVEWWLLEQHIKRAQSQVKAALAQLLVEELVIARAGSDGRVSYCVNRKRMQEIRRLLREQSKEAKGRAVS